MASISEMHWVAGLLEGEGCFHHCMNGNGLTDRKYFQVTIQLVMTDKDVVERAAKILGSKCHTQVWKTKGNKAVYRTNVHGPRAIGWMMTLHPLMASRRKARIAECITKWRTSGGKTDMGKYSRRFMPQEVVYGR